MTPSIKGGWLPESFEEFEQLRSRGRAKEARCFMCGEDFGPGNTRSSWGWRETQISGTCERCFDELMAAGDAQDSGVDQL